MRGTALRRRAHDLLLGVRLAVGGSRTPWGRLALTAIGIGLGVAVLLVASSVPNMQQARHDRGHALNVVYSDSVTDPALLVRSESARFRGEGINGRALQPVKPGAPLPKGLSEFPAPGEIVVSPALRDLLRSPEGKLLRPRFPERIVGTVGKAGLPGPETLYFYRGSDELSLGADGVGAVPVGGGTPAQNPPMNPQLWLTLAFGVTVLLVPIVVFVTSATRLAEAARERRLAALRLVGADARQVRRIASGEALVGSVLGVVLGWGLFLGGRGLAEHPPVTEISAYASDVWPVLPYAVVVTLGVPAVAVVAARASMRRTVIEPLGVVRHSRQGGRKLLWRLIPMALGIAGLLVLAAGDVPGSNENAFLASVAVLLAGVPLVLPWVIERGVRISGGSSLTGQLALRRLRATSGTAARSVSAIAVVLTGVIALQTVLASVEQEFATKSERPTTSEPYVSVHSAPTDFGQLREAADALRRMPETTEVVAGASFLIFLSRDAFYQAVVVDCATVRDVFATAGCRNGDVFRVTGQQQYDRRIRGGERLSVGAPHDVEGASGWWRVPADVGRLDSGTNERAKRFGRYDLVVTPAAASALSHLEMRPTVTLSLRPDASWKALERVRNTAAAHLELSTADRVRSAPDDSLPRTFRLISYGLLLGTMLAFVLIGCGLFVTAAEQIQERRRPMAVLAAVGTRRRTLAASALLQNAVPMLAAVLVSVVSGLVLGALAVTVIEIDQLVFDPLGLLGLLGIAAGAVLVVTALTLPALRRAMHPDGLHTE